MMPAPRWLFRARAERVVDGDTLDIVLDQGLRTTRAERIRLLGMDCPEVHGATQADGDAATTYTRQWLPISAPGTWPLVVETAKGDAFGRWLARVWRVADGRCLNDDLMAAGHAVAFHAAGDPPRPPAPGTA